MGFVPKPANLTAPALSLNWLVGGVVSVLLIMGVVWGAGKIATIGKSTASSVVSTATTAASGSGSLSGFLS